MFIEDLDLIEPESVTFRAMLVPDWLDLRMITVKLVAFNNNNQEHYFFDPIARIKFTQPMNSSSNLVWVRPHHMEIVYADWRAFWRRLQILRLLFGWFCQGLIEEDNLYPLIYECARMFQ